MNNLYSTGRLAVICLISFSLSLYSYVLFGENKSLESANGKVLIADLDPITPILECVEPLGNGRFKAIFGYDNPNNKNVTVPQGNSRVVWNGTQRQEKVLNKFSPGLVESVLEVEFDTNTTENGLTWIIRIPKKASMQASADANSDTCEPIIGAIENFNATPISVSQIDLSWDEPTSTEPFTYTLERSETGTDPWIEIANGLPQISTSFSDEGLDEFTEYTYRIRAGNNNATTGFVTTLARTNSDLSSADNFNGKNRDKIGPKLTSLAQGNAGDNPSDIIYQFDADGDVLVEIIPFQNPSTVTAIIDLLQTKYSRANSKFILDPNTYITEDKNRIDVYFEVDRLQELNLEAVVNFVQPAFRPRFGSIGATGVIYQGDSSQTSLDARKSFKTTRVNPSTGLVDTVFLDGGGQRLGIISNSFNTQPFSGGDSRYVVDQKNQDLPGPDNPFFPNPVAVLEEAPGSSSDEGRAMLQIAHDIAPGADLAFHTGLPTLNKFEEAITDLSSAGYNLIIDDVTFLIENYFGQYGPVFDAINNHLSADPLKNMYFSSAGNFADQAIEGTLNFVPLPAGSNIYPDSITGYIHDFGGGDLMLDIFANPGEYILGFQWEEPFSSLGDISGAANDLDMYVVDDMLQVEAGNNRINILGDALELLVLTSTGAKASNLVFTYEGETPPSNLKFRMIAFKISGDAAGAGLEFTEPISAPTVSGHAGFDLPNHVTVGASFYGYYGTGAGPDLEPFSSLGTSLGQNKVDITGPDGANINVLSIGSDIMFDSDVFNNFFGTSASAPAVAAAWALGLSAIPQWFPSGTPSSLFSDPSYATGNPVDEVTGLFLEAASPVSDPAVGGAGLLRVEEAFIGVAAQTPLLLDFEVVDGVISVDTAQVTLLGDYFSSGSQVFFNGDSVETTYVSENELSVTLMPFSGDAAFVVTNTAPITESMIEGGDSNPLDLLDGRRALTIVADDITKTFGQDFDDLTFSVAGLLTGETYESLGLPEVVLTSTAVGPYPDVNNYRIDASFATPLTPEQEEQYIVAFLPGVLSITSLPLTIQIADTTAVYGENPVFATNYIYDATGISDNAAFLDFLKASHESTFLTYTDSTTGVVNRFSAVVNRFSAVVNENPGRIEEIIDLLTNSNWVATETTIENRFSPVVNRFSAVVNYVPFDADQLLDFLDAPLIGNSGAIENRFSAVVNGEDLVTGLTSIFDPVENRFSPVVNRFSAVVNRFSAVVNVPLGNEDDETDLGQTLALVDAEDGNNTEFDTVAVYSINVITGLDVTLTNEDRHYMLSGTTLHPVFTNCIVQQEPGRLTVVPAPITITLDEIEPVTYAEPIAFTSTVSGNTAYSDTLRIDYFLNPNPASTMPISAGTYAVEQIASTTDSTGADNSINYSFIITDGPLVVEPRPLAVTLDDPGELNYGDPVEFTSTVFGALAIGDSLDIAYAYNPTPVSTDPVSVGSYSIEQTVVIKDSTEVVNNANYDLTVTNGSLTVNPATLTINTEDLLIEEGADLPPASDINSTITGYIPGEGPLDVFGPGGPTFSYSSPEYEMMGRVPGTYVLLTTVSPDPLNYNLDINSSALFVNLSDGRKIRIFLDCVDQNRDPNAEFPFTAYFSYENDNEFSIFIEPMSPANLLIGSSFDPSGLPFEFLPGSNQIAVPFVGNLRWKVATFGSTNPSSQEVDSNNLKGKRCKGKDIVNGRTANPESESINDTFVTGGIQYYPNPVNDHLAVRVNNTFTHNDYELYDSQGIRHSINAVINHSQATAEFDFSRFETGLYLLKLNINGTTAIIRVLRQ